MLDARLAEAARMVSSLMSGQRIAVAQAGGAPISVPMPAVEGYNRQLSCQIWSLDGVMVGRSNGAPDAVLTDAAAEGYSRSTVDGEPWHVYSVINRDLGVRVMVGDSLAVRDRLVRDVLAGLLLPVAMILPILALLIWVSVARGLAPLDRLAATLRARSPSDLSPLPAGPEPQEIRPVRRALDTLFARLAAARDVERDFTTYAAHELKTPLAGLRTQAQVIRLSDDPKVQARALAAIEKSVDRTDRMVRQLLELAAVDRSDVATEPTDPGRLMAETVDDLAVLAEARGVTVQILAPDIGGPLGTNPFLLRAALRNVVENAIHASPVGGRVTVALQRQGTDIELVVRDHGQGIPPDLRDRASERFTRGQAGGPNGSGLGLSIVASAMERLGGEVIFDDSDGEGQIVRLRLRGNGQG